MNINIAKIHLTAEGREPGSTKNWVCYVFTTRVILKWWVTGMKLKGQHELATDEPITKAVECIKQKLNDGYKVFEEDWDWKGDHLPKVEEGAL